MRRDDGYNGAAFFQAVARHRGSATCMACSVQPWQRSRCKALSRGQVDAHHVLPKQKIRRQFPWGAWRADDGTLTPIPRHDAHDERRPVDVGLGNLLMDPRNGVMLGRWHHDQLEARAWRPTFDAWPADVFEFAAELGMIPALERTYPL